MSTTCWAAQLLRLGRGSRIALSTSSRSIGGGQRQQQQQQQRRAYAVGAGGSLGSSTAKGARKEKNEKKQGVNVPTTPAGRAHGSSPFDSLFSLFTLVSESQQLPSQTQSRPLGSNDLALLIAALFSSTNNKLKIAKLEKIVPAFIEKYNYDTTRLYKKVNEFMNGFSAKGVDVESVERAIRARVGDAAVSGERGEHGLAKLDFPVDPSKLVSRKDLEGKSPLDQLFLYIETPYARSIIQNFEPEDMKEFSFLMGQVMDSSGRENMGVLNTIKAFLGLRGVEVVYLRNEEMKKVERASAEGVSESKTSMDEVELAKRAAADESLSKFFDKKKNAHIANICVSLDPLDTPTLQKNDPYPNLMTPDPLLDPRDEVVFPPSASSPYTNRVIVRNHASIFHGALEAESGTDPFSDPDTEWEPETTDETSEDLESFENLPLPANEVKNLYRFPLIVRRVTQQTGKGKIHRVQYLVVVGNGDGLVGYGQAKDEDAPRALAKATSLAIRNMDTVARFEKRTVPTEMETKLGSTRIIMRPRPVGFGLRCNPNLHQVLKAAGIKDVSAKVWGSRNPVGVVKAAFRMLWGGHAPVGMGDGVGGKGKKLDKGEGVRSVYDVERERGRRWVGLRM
ncbi:hypothetical protein AX15_005526 [Amanita polypyramis BW_CC]|nr:hypothetical protein AX15_005526 [Amanita polypyramis BW_CC]